MYVLECSICKEDEELFYDGHFYSLKSSLLDGSIPCGCAISVRWTREQYSTLCSRKAAELGYDFLGFTGEWQGAKTKLKLFCEKHGQWDSGCISHLLNNRKCPSCKLTRISKAISKPDEVMISSFLATGVFHPETEFWRSDKINNRGWRLYWFVLCPICGETNECQSSNLTQGKLSCGCSRHSQKQAYLNSILDENGTNVAIKFGISKDSIRRMKQQNSKTVYTITNHSIHVFPTVKSCKKAELECKQELECGILLRRDMPDGWSETTWVYNLDKIIEIYERNGGIRVE